MSFTRARASRIASSCPKDFDFQFFMFQDEGNYSSFYGVKRVLNLLYNLPEKGSWNCVILGLHLITLFEVVLQLQIRKLDIADKLILLKHIYNVLYAVYLIAIIYNEQKRVEFQELRFSYFRIFWYLVEIASFLHYCMPYFPESLKTKNRFLMLLAFHIVRMPRSFKFLFELNDYFLKVTILATLLKYIYFFVVMRIAYTFLLVRLKFTKIRDYDNVPAWLSGQTNNCYRMFYQVYKMFLQVKLMAAIESNRARAILLVTSMSGYVMFLGITVTAVSLVVALHIRSSEVFRLRIKLIISNFLKQHISSQLRDKVLSFYNMYWQKQKAISSSELLNILSPGLVHAIYTDIYFEAQQKTRVLRDTSFQFLSEVAKVMEIVNYVPGDTIVSRKSPKSTMFFIEYGDVEVLTAEDDDTPILRFTRGSIINPCGLAVEVAAAQAHVAVRAATFCTAHILRIKDFWRVCAQFGRFNGQNFILRSSFEEHFEKVKKHYPSRKTKLQVKYKSSILILKRNLIALKEARDADGNPLMGRTDKFIDVAGCYIMRNSLDSSLMEETDNICLKPTFPCILQPSSSLLLIWQGFIVFVTFCVAFLQPYRIAYNFGDTSLLYNYFDFVITILYSLDVAVILSTGENMEEGVPVTFTKTCSEQMKNPVFFLDLLAALPFMYLITPNTPCYHGTNKLIKVPKIFMFFVKLEEIYIFYRNLLRFIQYIFLLIFTLFWVAALKQDMFCNLYHMCRIDNYTNNLFWKVGDTSLVEDNTDVIVISLYWAINLLNFSDVKTMRTIHSWSTTLMEIGLLELASVMRILTSAIYAATIMVTHTMRDEYKTAMKTIEDFLTKIDVNRILHLRFMEYFKLCWESDNGYSITHQRKSIMYDLPQHVLKEVLTEQRHSYLRRLRFWKYLSQENQRLVSYAAQAFYCAPNEILLNTGDSISELYVIRKGFCEVYCPRTKQVVDLITSGAYFGDIESILRIPVYYSVRAVTHVQLYTLSRKHMNKFLDTRHFRDAVRHCRMLSEYRPLLKRREPFLTFEPIDPPKSRQIFPLLRKHEPDIAFQAPFHRLGFFAVLRYVFPRFTIRPDGPYLRRYEWFRAVCAFLSSLIYPTYAWLYHQLPILEYIVWFLDISAYIDLFQRTLIGYYDSKGILVYHPASTAAHYIKTAFIVDLIACLPFEDLDSMRLKLRMVNGRYSQPGLCTFLMYNRGLQLYRTIKTLGTLEDYISRQDVVLIIQVTPVFLGALSVFVSCLIEESCNIYIDYNREGEGKWFISTQDGATEYGHWITTFNTKAVRYNISGTPWNIIITSYFWMVYETTCTNYGYFLPHSRSLVTILIIAIFVVGLIQSYVAMRIIGIRSNVDKALVWFQEHMRDLKTYMQTEYFSEEIQDEVVSYFAYRWEKMGATNYRTLLKLCNQITLRTDAILHIYGPTFMRCPILRRCEQTLIRQLGRGVHSDYYKEGMTIVDQDDVLSQLFFIEYGTVEVYKVQNNHDRLITKLPRGSVFGNIGKDRSFLCTNKFLASADVHLLVLQSEIFFKIVSDFQKVMDLLIKYRPHDENYVIGIIAGSTKVMTTWRERALSTAIIAVSSKGFLKHFSGNSKPIQIYLMCVSVLSIFATVYNASFVHSDVLTLVILYFLDILFFLKVVMSYLVSYLGVDDAEKTILSGKKKKYFKELKYDVLSCLPIEAFAFFRTADRWRFFGILRLNRLLRIISLQKCLIQYRKQLSINLTVTTVLTVLLWFLLMIHIISCVWYSLGDYEDNQVPYSSWRYQMGSKELICSEYSQYFCSVYFVMCTFIRQGVVDIGARTQTEVVFVSMLMIFSSMVFMIFIGEFSNILQFQSIRVMEYYIKREECESFLKSKNVAPALVDQVRKYGLYLWREQRGIQMPLFIQEAPQCLKNKVMATAYLSHLVSHEVFVECENAFLRQLVGCLRVYTYMEGMYVVKEGEVSDAMYFIHKGTVKEVSDDYDEELRDFHTDHHFGTFNGLNPNNPYQYSYKTVTRAIVLHLYFNDWKHLLDHFPASKNIIFEIQDQEKDFDKGVKHTKGKSIFTKAAKVLFGPETKSNIQKSASQEDMDGRKFMSFHRKSTRKSTMTPLKNMPPGISQEPMFLGIPSGRDSEDRFIPYSAEAGEVEPKMDLPSFGQKPIIRRKSLFQSPKKDDGAPKERRKSVFLGIDAAVPPPTENRESLLQGTDTDVPAPTEGQQSLLQDTVPALTEGQKYLHKDTDTDVPAPTEGQQSVLQDTAPAPTEGQQSLLQDTAPALTEGQQSLLQVTVPTPTEGQQSMLKDTDTDVPVPTEIPFQGTPTDVPVHLKDEAKSLPQSQQLPDVSIPIDLADKELEGLKAPGLPLSAKRSSEAETEVTSINYSKKDTEKELKSSFTDTEETLVLKRPTKAPPADESSDSSVVQLSLSRSKSILSFHAQPELKDNDDDDDDDNDAMVNALLESISNPDLPDDNKRMSVSSDIFLEVLHDPTARRSVLSFKDEVETVEIPKEDRPSIYETRDIKLVKKDQLHSLLSFAGDITLKAGGEDNKSEKVGKTDSHATISSHSMGSSIAASAISLGGNDSLWSVERYMMKGKAGDEMDKKAPRVDSVISTTSETSIFSDSKSMTSMMSLQEGQDTPPKVPKKKAKRGLMWKEEDTKATTSNLTPAWLQGPMHFDMLNDRDLEKGTSSKTESKKRKKRKPWFKK